MSKIKYGKGDDDYCVDIESGTTEVESCNLCGSEVNELGYCVRCGYVNKEETKDKEL